MSINRYPFCTENKHISKATTDIFKKQLIPRVEYGQPGENIKFADDVIDQCIQAIHLVLVQS